MLKRHPIVIVLDSLKCAHNIGTILRLSDALLLEKVYICGNTITPPNGKLRNASRGAEKWVPWEYRSSTPETVRELKAKGFLILSLEIANTSVDYREIELTFPLCIVLGREYDGIAEEVCSESDVIAHLPLYGMANSINVSTAASVLMFKAMQELEKL